VSGLLSYQGRQVGFKGEKMCFGRIQERCKSYKIWDPKDIKFILSRDVMFD